MKVKRVKNDTKRQARNAIACVALFIANTGQQRDTEHHTKTVIYEIF